jgi:acyl-CoA synthetase (AMP-forming)/AMP-acid ligase II
LQLQPDGLAVCFGDRRRTFREFGDRVSRFAAALQSLGMRPGDRVAMLALNSDRYLEYLMAVPWGSGVLNPCNIRWSTAEIAYSLDDSQSSILIFDEAFAPVASALSTQCKTLRALIYAGDGQAPAGSEDLERLLREASPVADAGCAGNDLAGIFYTGGTTGYPKGVMLSHANLMWCALSGIAMRHTRKDDVLVYAPPMFHVAGFAAAQMFWLLGGRHAIIPAYNPRALAECVARERATDVVLIPTMIQMLVNDPMASTQYDLSSLRRIIYAGSPISEALLERALALFPRVEFFHAYGMTESSGAVTVLGPEHHTPDGRARGTIRSAGQATYVSVIKIVDPEGREVPRGTVGEIAVKGPVVMLGYWHKPDQTAAALCDGWLRTGDAAYMDTDGFVYVVDRLKDMIITGGENVYSVEVENAIARHCAVAQCAVIGVPSESWGEAVHAFVVLKAGHSVAPEELVAHARDLIAHYKCPRSIELVAALPMSAAGKILKHKLREPYWRDRRAVN